MQEQINDFNFAADTDSYKYSHGPQVPKSLAYCSSYGEARSDAVFRGALFSGMQVRIKDMLEKPLTMADVDFAYEMAMAHCGTFPLEMMKKIVTQYGGLPPVRIQALPEGLVVPNRTALWQIANLDPSMPTLPQFMEDQILRDVWYMSTVATLSWHIKQDILAFLNRTCDNPEEEIAFRLHDFGARGASSRETAAHGGLAHLINFMGTDTVLALYAARRYYGEKVAGFSIPAMEHFTVTAWGRENEAQAYANMVDTFGGEGRIYACVSDAYDIFNAVDNIWGQQLKDRVLAKGGRLVVRPDSGDPTSVVLYCVKSLARSFGTTTNKKGFQVLHPAVRVIQGDGVNRESIKSILTALEINGFSAENVAFGMGGALLQGVNRDTLGFAQKASAITSGHSGWIGISKEPVTAKQKVSKKGRLAVVRESDSYLTIQESELGGRENLLQDVFDGQSLVRDMSFSEVRENANRSVLPRL